LTALVLLASAVGSLDSAHSASAVTNIPFADALPILRDLRPDLIPDELLARRQADLESTWPVWVAASDRAIRSRLAKGDEDSLVNLVFFGVTFTKQPRLSETDVFNGVDVASDVVKARIADFVSAVGQRDSNDRLVFARDILAQHSIDPTTAGGRAQTRIYLEQSIVRFVAETQKFIRENNARFGATPADPTVEVSPGETVYRDRGLSSDTSIFPDFAISQTLEGLKAESALKPGEVRRVAVIGPGLDFTDKREGFDFYPQQTLQPFAVADSLLRLKLSTVETLRVVTLDLSPRVNGHIEAARQRARDGRPYVIQLVRDASRWNPALISYWQLFGDSIGNAVTAIPPPPEVHAVDARAVSVRPSIVLAVTPIDLNVVLQRLELTTDDQFDLVIATNVFLYYNVFEQSLAMVNVARMLRPGGWLLTNSPVVELPTTPVSSVGHLDVVYNDRSAGRDRIVLYRRQ
jgi:hypothetical protein